MFNKNTKMFLLLALILFAVIGLSTATAANTDNNAADTDIIAEDTTTADAISDNSITSDVSNKAEISKNTQQNVKSEGESPEESTPPNVHVLNNENWTEYFNDDLTIKDSVNPNSELQFEGTFNDKEMIINIPVTITTAENQAILNNCTFLVISNNVTITKLEMNGNDLEQALITIEDASNVKIEDNFLTLSNTGNRIETTSILVDGGSNNIIRNNEITTTGPEEKTTYDEDYSIDMIYTTSIKANSDRLVIEGNKIHTKKNEADADPIGTLIGVYVYGDSYYDMISDVEIINNKIYTSGEIYEYGIKVYFLENSIIENNTVITTSDTFGSSIHVFAIIDSLVENNTVETYANMGYGIVLEGFFYLDYETFEITYSVPENVLVTENTVNIDSKYAWAIETFGGIENIISFNNITVDCDMGIGIGLTDEETAVAYNNIIVNSEMTGDSLDSYDFIDPYTTGVKITRNSVKRTEKNVVIANNIVVNAPDDGIYAINSTTQYNDIEKNYLVSPSAKGDDAVIDYTSTCTIEKNVPGTIITDDTYQYFFDETNSLMEEYNNTELIISGEFFENNVFIFDGVNVTITNDGTAELYDGQVVTIANATVVFDGLVFDNTIDAFVLESEGNVIKNTEIYIESDEAIHAIYVYEGGNIITNTQIYVEAPSADVEYNPNYSTKSPAPAAIVLSSDNNLIEDVTIFFNGTKSTGFFPTVDGIYIVSETSPVKNNTIKDTEVVVTGSNFVYGINIGNAKDTTIEDIIVIVNSSFYSDAIQLFDADNITITGNVIATADSEAYGVYSTAMGYGFSQNIDLSDLNVNVNAPLATGTLIEGASNVIIADATYSIKGETASAIKGYVDFMNNMPENIVITRIKANIEASEESDAIYFGQSRDITISDSEITSNIPSYIMFINVTDVKLIEDKIINSTIATMLISDITADGLLINNTGDAFILESAGNIIKNTEINIDSDDAIHAIYLYEDGNIISDTVINVVAPSADVEYNPDYTTKSPAPAAIVINSDNNLIDDVTIYFDGTESTGFFPTVDGIYIVSETIPVVNNTIKDSTIIVVGSNYVYGINVGNAKDTTIEDVEVDVDSAYYSDAIQLFDADTISITGKAIATADSEAYGLYSTAMGYGFSQNIDLSGLDVTVDAPKATGVLIEGASNVLIADASYDITGDEATAIKAHVDFMENIPTNITITGLDISIDTTGDANILYFGKSDNILITENNIEANDGNKINFNSTTNGVVTDNYILVGEMLETGIFGNYAVMTTEDDTIVENNTPTSKLVDDLNDKINELEEQLAELTRPKETTITIDPLEDVKYGDEITISGILVNEDGFSLSNQELTIVFNDEETTVTTRNGEFTYTTTANVLGENTITATFAGNDKNRESEATYTFEVAKVDTFITIEDIEAVKKGETVTITGTLTDHNGNPLANKVVRLLINNGRKTLKTDADGVYTFDYALTKVGENTITATFEGDDYCTESTETITVEALALSTQITIDPVDTIVKGTKATFTGILTDENGEAIANAQVKLNINGNTKTLKTDSEGRFTHTYTMNTVGENTITATYAGSTSYEAAQTQIKVKVKDETTITLDPIESITIGDNATFTGKLTDVNGKGIANAQVRITINGSPKTLRTDENGVFTHTFKMIKEGTNNITAIFNGNNQYIAAETSSTVEVIKAE